MRSGVLLALAGLLLLPCAAHAEWREASSAHFVVYADDSERDIRKFSEQLERYHAAMTLLLTRPLPEPSPSNRVTVYVVSSEDEVRKLYGANSRYIGGFYIPRAGASVAIVPRVLTGTKALEYSMTTLLHEYAHHFMIASSPYTMPRWYSEGAAEFFAAARFPAKGGVEVGRPAIHRAAELLVPGFARDVTVAELLDPPTGNTSRRYDAFYGKSWLLFHYLTFSEPRKGQLTRYLEAVMRGKSSREAGVEAFGDFDKLERELDAYVNKSLTMFALPPSMISTGAITVRGLSAGEAAMMPVRIRSRRGIDDAQAKALLPEARRIAARYPDDAAVLATLAEAEHDAGNEKEAVAAADAAIAKDPAQVNAYVQKGFALFQLAADAPDREAAYKVARAPFVALNRRETDHPLPLIYYYRSFVEQGKAPSDLALQGLVRASEIAPFDLGLRMNLGVAMLRRKQFALARANLAPVAYNPHGGALATEAQRVLARMDADPTWDGSGLTAITSDEDTE